MPDTDQIAAVLHQADETHRAVYADTDGEDPDWATFYSDWLLNHSPLPEHLGRAPVRSHLAAELVALDERFRQTHPNGNWERFYAQDLIERFAAWPSASRLTKRRAAWPEKGLKLSPFGARSGERPIANARLPSSEATPPVHRKRSSHCLMQPSLWKG